MSGPPRQAVVLAAGRGRRLAPHTDRTPKPLLPFLNVPLLHHTLAWLACQGMSRVVLNAWHRAERLVEAVADRPADGLTVDVVVEDRLLGTGGGLGHLARRLEPGPVVVTAGDILAPVDLAALHHRHVAAGALATMTLTAAADPARYGPVTVDAAGHVRDIVGRLGRPGVRDLVNASVHLIEPAFLEVLPDDRPACLVRDGYLVHLASGAPVAGYLHAGPWAETGTLAAWRASQRAALAGRLPVAPALLAAGGRPGPGAGPSLVHRAARVSQTARLTGGTTVAAGARVGAGADLDGCIVLPGAVVAAATRLGDAVVPAGPPGQVLSGTEPSLRPLSPSPRTEGRRRAP